jgi:uncharacterized protein YdhG (YjbR/CyaY superfamily)
LKISNSRSAARLAKPARNIDAYLRRIPPGSRAVLKKLRRTIKSTAPKAEEGISYGIPVFKHQGHLVYFAAYKNHCSLFAAGKSVLKTFSTELKPFDISGSTIHFSPENPLPANLVRRIVKARIEENERRSIVSHK